MDGESPLFRTATPEFRPADVSIRLARRDESRRWNALMEQHHYIGFKRFAGRGLRYVFEWQGQWIGMAGWQYGSYKCHPRDRWIGWPKSLQFTRLHLIVSNTRFLILGSPGRYPNLASLALTAMTRRLSDDWQDAYGHGVLLAETFVDPARFSGHMYTVAGWTPLGHTKGFARSNGKYTDPHGVPKELHILPLRRDARRRLCTADPLPDGLKPKPTGRGSKLPPARLRSLHKDLQQVPDFRRAQGQRHTIASVAGVIVAARLAGIRSGIGAAQFARELNQKELASLGTWYNRRTTKYEPPSKSVIYRFLDSVDPAEIERTLKRWSVPRLELGAAIAADCKRIRGAGHNGDDCRETAILITHDTGLPIADHGLHDESGEGAAVHALLKEVPVAGRVITLDALHTIRETARSIVETHRADYLMMVTMHAPETFRTLGMIDWNRNATNSFQEDAAGAHGYTERQHILTMRPLPGMVNYPHVAQFFRVERKQEVHESGAESPEVAFGMTSVSEDSGSPEQLLEWSRGHWSIEGRSNRGRDIAVDEDAHSGRREHAHFNCADHNSIALAITVDRNPDIAEAASHFAQNRNEVPGAFVSHDCDRVVARMPEAGSVGVRGRREQPEENEPKIRKSAFRSEHTSFPPKGHLEASQGLHTAPEDSARRSNRGNSRRGVEQSRRGQRASLQSHAPRMGAAARSEHLASSTSRGSDPLPASQDRQSNVILFVGLGNPGARHARMRHNIGFMAVDRIARDHVFGPWKNRFRGLVSERRLAGRKVLLLKPETFMNLSGESVAEAMRFYKMDPADVTVLHDEIDLPPGKTRVKTGGGHAGHNGLKSIDSHIGRNYRRVRLGIGHPGHKDLVSRYVLHDFAKADGDWLEHLLRGVSDGAEDLAAGDTDRFMNAIAAARQATHPKPADCKPEPRKPVRRRLLGRFF